MRHSNHVEKRRSARMDETRSRTAAHCLQGDYRKPHLAKNHTFTPFMPAGFCHIRAEKGFWNLQRKNRHSTSDNSIVSTSIFHRRGNGIRADHSLADLPQREPLSSSSVNDLAGGTHKILKIYPAIHRLYGMRLRQSTFLFNLIINLCWKNKVRAWLYAPETR